MKLIILDRDGVLNEEREDFIKTPEEWVPIDSSMQAVSRLNEAGYRVVLATNQSGIGRGMIVGLDTLNRIHQKCITRWVASAVGWMPSSSARMRRTRGVIAARLIPGMFEDIAHRCETDLADVPAVGDKLSDIRGSSGSRRPPDSRAYRLR